MQVRFYCDLRCAPDDAAATVSFLQSKVVGREIQNIHPIVVSPRGESNQVSVAYEGILGLTTQAATFLTEIQDRWTQGPAANRILSGSIVRWHECHHDIGSGDCSAAIGNEAIKP